jgi:hypothetical protein
MTNEAKQQLTIWWVSWVAFLGGLFAIYQAFDNTAAQPQAPYADSPIWLAGVAPMVVSTIIRWFVLPRARSAQAALQLFIFGIALAEATCFLGLFIFPAHKQGFFVLSVLGIFQFVPYFAGRFFSRDDQNQTA